MVWCNSRIFLKNCLISTKSSHNSNVIVLQQAFVRILVRHGASINYSYYSDVIIPFDN